MLITHFIGLAMGLGTGFAFMFLGMAAAKMPKEEAEQFALKTYAMNKMGNIGLILLFISGGYLMTSYWSNLTNMPLMMAKLVLFLVLGALIGINSANIRKAGKADHVAPHLKKAKTLGQLTLVTALAIVILAVLSFH